MRLALVLVSLLVGVAACSGGSDSASAPRSTTSAPVTAIAPTTTTTYPFSYAPVATHPEAFRGFGELAYVSGGQLSVLDGTGAAPHTVGNGVEVAKAQWSPDGRWLAYEEQGREGGGGDVLVVPAAGGAAVDLGEPLAWQWSPTRDVLAVVAPDGQPNGYGGSVRVVRPDDPTTPVALVNPAYLPAYTVSWSPDGRRLAFVVHQTGQPAIDHLFTVDVGCGGTSASRLREVPVDVPIGEGDNGLEFAGWTGDSRRVFVWIDEYHSGSIRLDGLGLVSVALDGGADATLQTTLAKPSWITPVPGRAEVLLDAGNGRIWDQARVLSRCSIASGACAPLVVGTGPTLDPAVSPGGGRLAYVATDRVAFDDPNELPPASSVRWNRTRRLVVAGIDGSGARTVSTGGVIAPRWAKDGRHLLFARGGYLWLVDADTGTETAVAGPIDSLNAYGSIPPDPLPFEENAYLFPGNDVWDQTAWLP